MKMVLMGSSLLGLIRRKDEESGECVDSDSPFWSWASLWV